MSQYNVGRNKAIFARTARPATEATRLFNRLRHAILFILLAIPSFAVAQNTTVTLTPAGNPAPP
jgi:hypothetical protein